MPPPAEVQIGHRYREGRGKGGKEAARGPQQPASEYTTAYSASQRGDPTATTKRNCTNCNEPIVIGTIAYRGNHVAPIPVTKPAYRGSHVAVSHCLPRQQLLQL